ncbi:MAG: precorrin-6A reductase [Desulfocucumaceae bacterium]
MILVIGGTSEARAIARELARRGAGVLVSTATAYGARLAAEDGVGVLQGRMEEKEIKSLIAARGIRVVIDASHPFATGVTAASSGACAGGEAKYIRYARPEEQKMGSPGTEAVNTYQEAAGRACDLGNTIFLSTGSKTAGIFLNMARDRGRRIIIRVLPDPGVISRLLDMGFSPLDLVAMQGPFSEEVNLALWRHFRVDVVVTKESGPAGGLGEKLSAARRLGIPVVIIKRPPEPPDAAGSVEEAVKQAMDHLESRN